MKKEIEIVDASGDKKYFIIVPRIVWVKCRNPYDFALWIVVKDVAGQDGECYLTTRDLAKLAMMSRTMAQRSRDYLIKAGLLVGEIRHSARYPIDRWYLRVPDLWQENAKWSTDNVTIQERINWKTLQKDIQG